MKKKSLIVYIAILTLQLLTIFYWVSHKTNFFVDEFYSMMHARSFTGLIRSAEYIPTSQEWRVNEWVENSEYKKLLTMDSDGFINKIPLDVALKRAATHRNYFALLNAMHTIMGCEEISMVPAMAINIPCFLIASIALLILLKRLGTSNYTRVLALFMFGFSNYIISSACYVRFYMLVIAIMLIGLNLLLWAWKSDKLGVVIGAELGFFALGYIAYQNSETAAFYLFAVSIVVIIGTLISKKYKLLFTHLIICFSGFIYLFIREQYFWSLLGIGNMEEADMATKWITKELANPPLDIMADYPAWIIQLFCSKLWGNYRILILLIFTLSVYAVLAARKNKDNKTANVNLKSNTIAIFVIWLIVWIISTYVGLGELICLACLTLAGINLVLELMGLNITIDKVNLNDNDKYIIALAITALIYSVSTSFPEFRVWRYYSHGFVLFFIVFAYSLDRVLQSKSIQKHVSNIKIIFVVFAALAALAPFAIRNIEYIYEKDADLLENIAPYVNEDVVLICTEDYKYDQHIYDCVNIMSGNTRIYTLFSDEAINKNDIKSQFLLWGTPSEDLTDIVENIVLDGYHVEKKGTNHISEVYFCEKVVE